MISCEMLPRILPVFLFFAFSISAHQVDAQVQATPALRVTLERAYESWRTAMEEGDLEKWKATTAFSRQIETQNRIISQRLPFPDVLFEDPVESPSLAGLIAMGVLSTPETATSTYFGNANFGGDGPAAGAENMLVLHFLREDGVWKFDNLRLVKIGNDGEILLQIKNGDFSFLQGEEFQPLPQLPPLPQPVSEPEFLAKAWIDSTGYETTIIINGISMGKYTNVKTTELILGGVRSGGNTIEIQVSPSSQPVQGAPKVEVAVYAAKGAEDKANRVFHFKPGADVPASVRETFGAQ